MTGHHATKRTEAGFSLLEIMVVLTVVSILALAAASHMVGARQKAWNSACDDNEYKLVQELQNEIDSRSNEGDPFAAKHALLESVQLHQTHLNPFNQQMQAYTLISDSGLPTCSDSYVPPADTKCQVVFCYEDQTTVVGHQFWPHAPRSFRIVIE